MPRSLPSLMTVGLPVISAWFQGQPCSLLDCMPLARHKKKGPYSFPSKHEPKGAESCQNRALPAGWHDGWQSSAESCLIWVKDTVWEATLPELSRCVGASPVSCQLILAAACCFWEKQNWSCGGGWRLGQISPFTSAGMKAAAKFSMGAWEFLHWRTVADLVLHSKRR